MNNFKQKSVSGQPDPNQKCACFNPLLNLNLSTLPSLQRLVVLGSKGMSNLLTDSVFVKTMNQTTKESN